MNIRRMQETDLPAIIRITRVAWEEMTLYKLLEDRHGLIGTTGWRERKTDEVVSFCEAFPCNVIVALEDDDVVGYATFWIEPEDKIGHVGNNAVDPPFQGRGVGTAMINWIMESFRDQGLRLARVSTLAHDMPAQRVYQKQGFTELARMIHYSMTL